MPDNKRLFLFTQNIKSSICFVNDLAQALHILSVFFLLGQTHHTIPKSLQLESQNQQWQPPEKRRDNEARRVPENEFTCLGSCNEINQKRIVEE